MSPFVPSRPHGNFAGVSSRTVTFPKRRNPRFRRMKLLPHPRTLSSNGSQSILDCSEDDARKACREGRAVLMETACIFNLKITSRSFHIGRHEIPPPIHQGQSRSCPANSRPSRRRCFHPVDDARGVHSGLVIGFPAFCQARMPPSRFRTSVKPSFARAAAASALRRPLRQ